MHEGFVLRRQRLFQSTGVFEDVRFIDIVEFRVGEHPIEIVDDVLLAFVLEKDIHRSLQPTDPVKFTSPLSSFSLIIDISMGCSMVS